MFTYAENIRAEKLVAAQKIVGSDTSNVPASDKGDNSNDTRPAHEANGIHVEAQELAGRHAESENQQKSGIESPNETAVPKKRGHPKKVALSG